MARCTTCGSITTGDDSRFCVRCGSPIEREPDSLQVDRRRNDETVGSAPDNTRSGFQRLLKGIGSGCLVVVLALVVLIVVGICAAWNEEDPEASLQESNCTGFAMSGSEFAELTKSEFEQQLREVGCSEQQIENSLSTFEDEKARQARWVEQWDHWANLDAFMASAREISADRVIDRDESARICFLLPQWESQLEAARDYVESYREAEPDVVANTPSLENLQSEAERGLALLSQIECN